MVTRHDHFDLLDKIVLERVVFYPPFKVNATMHDEACFLYVVKGNSRLYTPKEQLNVATSESLVMKCGSYLNNWLRNKEEQPNEALAVHFYPDVLKVVYGNEVPDFFAAKNKARSKQVEKIPSSTIIRNYVNSLLFYFNNPSLVTEELIQIKVKEIILLLLNTENSSKITSILSDLFQNNQYEFKEIIHNHLFENLSNADLAILTGMSLSSFKRKFNAIFGISPSRYIKRKRLEKAKELLGKTNLKITAVAFDSGFNDLGSFSKSFVTSYGFSPSDYRKKMRTTKTQTNE